MFKQTSKIKADKCTEQHEEHKAKSSKVRGYRKKVENRVFISRMGINVRWLNYEVAVKIRRVRKQSYSKKDKKAFWIKHKERYC